MAELRLAAELLRAKVISGRRADMERWARVEGLVNRLAAKLGLDMAPQRKQIDPLAYLHQWAAGSS